MATALAHVQQPVPALGKLVPGLPAELSDLVGALLTKDPAQRVPSALVLGGALAGPGRWADRPPPSEPRGIPATSGGRSRLGMSVSPTRASGGFAATVSNGAWPPAPEREQVRSPRPGAGAVERSCARLRKPCPLNPLLLHPWAPRGLLRSWLRERPGLDPGGLCRGGRRRGSSGCRSQQGGPERGPSSPTGPGDQRRRREPVDGGFAGRGGANACLGNGPGHEPFRPWPRHWRAHRRAVAARHRDCSRADPGRELT